MKIKNKIIFLLLILICSSCSFERYSKKYLLYTHERCKGCSTLNTNLNEHYPKLDDFVLITCRPSNGLSHNGEGEYIDIDPEVQYLLIFNIKSKINGYYIYEFSNVSKSFNKLVGAIDYNNSILLKSKITNLQNNKELKLPIFKSPIIAYNLLICQDNIEKLYIISNMYRDEEVEDKLSLELLQTFLIAIKEAEVEHQLRPWLLDRYEFDYEKEE